MAFPSQFENILAQCPCFLTLLNREGQMTWLSHGAYGHDHRSFIGLPGDTAVLEDDRHIWWDSFYRAQDDRAVVRYRLRIGTPEPPYVAVLEGRLSPVVFDNTVSHLFCVAWDVSRGTTDRSPIPVGIPAGARWLSPLEERVVRYLDANRDRWIGSAELAAEVGEPNGHRFKSQLTGLVDRAILEARTGSGYRIAR